MPDQSSQEPDEGTKAAATAKLAAKADVTPEPYVERHGVDGWKERARSRFGVSPHAVAGALHNLGDEELSAKEAQARIAKYLGRP